MPTERCSEIARWVDEPLIGTASTVRRWVLVEYEAPWPARTWAACVPSAFAAAVERFAKGHGARPVLIRRPLRAPVGAGLTGRLLLVVADGQTQSLRELVVDPADAETALSGEGAGAAADGDFASLGEPYDGGPVFLVCVHATHDVCCGIRGRALVRDALAQSVNADLWECSHIGGDRFAANVVVLPNGVYYGNVAASDLGAIVDATAAGRLHADCLRGWSYRSRPEQVAEHAIRSGQSLWAEDDVAAVRCQSVEPRHWRVEVDHVGGTTVVDVQATAAEPRRLTCAADTPAEPLTFTATPLP